MTNKFTEEQYQKIVGKEKKYRWSGKLLDEHNEHILLYKSKRGAIYGILVADNGSLEEDEQLTESEIKAWGYNPDMFNREEVQ